MWWLSCLAFPTHRPWSGERYRVTTLQVFPGHFRYSRGRDHRLLGGHDIKATLGILHVQSPCLPWCRGLLNPCRCSLDPASAPSIRLFDCKLPSHSYQRSSSRVSSSLYQRLVRLLDRQTTQSCCLFALQSTPRWLSRYPAAACQGYHLL